MPRGRPGAVPLRPAALAAILVAEGYASLSAEILALRRLAPHAGTAVTVTAVVLAVYLAALACGYRRGGRLARRADPRRALALRLALAAAWASFWLADAGVLLAFSLPLPTVWQVAAYSLAGPAPVGWLLAECVLLAHACAADPDASRSAGGVFALSTAGNVAGSLLCAFLLLPRLGLAAATLAVAGALCAASLLASRRHAPAAALLPCCLWLGLDLWAEATVYVERNAHADYSFVPVGGGGRMLEISGQPSSRHDARGRGWEYAEALERALCAAGERRALVLGAAGMTLGRGAPCALELTFADIDPAQERIAGEFLGLPPGAAGRFVAGDARAVLRGSGGGWQAIVVDVFSDRRSVPGHLATAEFYREARAALAPGGALYLNHVAAPGHARFLERAQRTLRSVFAACSERRAGLPPGAGWHEEAGLPHNLLLRCEKGPRDGDRAVYSDSLPRAALDRPPL